MPKCPACGTEVQDGWKYCPGCSARLDSAEKAAPLEVVTYRSLDRARYLWERQQGGKVIFNNFEIIRKMGDVVYRDAKPVRKKLGDYEHINLVNLRKYSFVYLNPDQIYEVYAIGKLIGYYMVPAGLGGAPILADIVNKLSKTGIFWKVFENDLLQEVHTKGWKNAGAGLIHMDRVDRSNKKLFFHVKESPSAVQKAKHASCFMEVGSFCGWAEGLFGGMWDGRETKCQAKGDEYNEHEIYLHELEEEPKIDTLTKEELDSILDQIVENTVSRRQIRSNELTDQFYCIVDQVMNYYLLSLSPGHAVMSKYAGRICGERIADKAQLQGQDAALTYLEDMFLYLKAGIIRSEKAGDRVIIRMKESVYASGVNNIHQNLCIFLAGIIEGALNKATGQKWDVSEMKCLASGFPECEFWCKKI